MREDLYKIRLNNSVNYEGKLNDHKDYIKMLNILEKECDFIGIDSEHEIVIKFKDDIIKIEKSNTWWGIETSFIATLYYIKSSKKLFECLNKYETFCKYIVDFEHGDYVEETSFGVNDIAFFDKDYNLLLRTNTHEGFIFVNQSIDELFKQ